MKGPLVSLLRFVGWSGLVLVSAVVLANAVESTVADAPLAIVYGFSFGALAILVLDVAEGRYPSNKEH